MKRGWVIALAWLLVAAPAAAQPDDRAAAYDLANQALDALDARDYARARELVERAEARYHAPTHLAILGEALEGLGKSADALAVYERLLDEPLAADPPAAFVRAREDARQRVAALVAKVPSVIVTVAGPAAGSARLAIDGVEQPAGAAVRLNPGNHSVRVEAPGFEPAEQRLDLASGAAVATVEIRLVASAPPPSGAPPFAGHEPEPEGEGPLWPAGVAFGIGGAGLVLGIAAGAASLDKVAELGDACPAPETCPETDTTRALYDEAETLGHASTAGFVIAGIGAAAGTTLLILRPGGASASGVRVSAELGGVRVYGSF